MNVISQFNIETHNKPITKSSKLFLNRLDNEFVYL